MIKEPFSSFSITEQSRQSLAQAYTQVRAYSEFLCESLQMEDYVPQKAEFVSPPKWHLAHTTWFFEEMILAPYGSQFVRHNERYPYLFNSYYNTMGERIARADRGMITRPSVQEIYTYRHAIDQAMNDLLENEPSEIVLSLVELGLHHEQQHQELLITDLKYNFSFNPTHPIYSNESTTCSAPQEPNEWIDIEAGIYSIGHQGPDFCFDNERGCHRVFLEGYSIASALVTNDEFLAFMEDGGYQRFDLWLEEGWAWVNSQSVTAPLYWKQVDGKWHHFSLNGLCELKGNDAVTHLNYYEAQAFAAWKKMRLPTEFEWEAAAHRFRWGDRWEWCQSAYLPYPGFETSAGAVGEYNGKFMVNQMVLRGASKATSPGHSRPSYRNFFHPAMQWQYSGIRLAR